MSRLCYYFLVFQCLLGSAQQITSDSLRKQLVLAERKSFEALRTQSGGQAANTYNIVYTRCTWTLNPAVKTITGLITTWFKPLAGNFDSMEFDLAAVLTVDSVKYHNGKLNFSRPGDLVKITLPAPLQAATLDSINVFYHGVPQASFTKSTHAGADIIWTLSEPFGSKEWWPCKQNLSDKIDSLDVFVTTTPGNRVAGNGVLISEITSGNTKTVHWKTRYPMATYLVGVAVTNYDAYTESVVTPNGTVQVLNYVYPEETSWQSWGGSGIGEVIKLYDSLTIAYPFAAEKYGHAQFSGGGGMEHQTISFVTIFDYSLLAHECAHQWFGDHVTCGSWSDIWLNESFATYFEGLCLQRYHPLNWLGWRQSKLANITAQPDGSVWCSDTANASRIFDSRLSYDKGAYVLHMLRWQVGDSAFFHAIKNYLTDPKLKQNYARTADLVRHMESSSKQNLGKFFDQWYYKQGYPTYTLNWSQQNKLLTIKLDQAQSHASVTFFEMPVPIKLIGRTKDSTLRLLHQFSGQTFTIAPSFTVTDIVFDPEYQLLSGKNTVLNLNEEKDKKNSLRIYPNPGDNLLYIEGFANGVIPEEIILSDALGRIVLDKIDFSQFNGKTVVGIGHLESGLYTLSIMTNAGKKSLRFLKK